MLPIAFIFGSFAILLQTTNSSKNVDIAFCKKQMEYLYQLDEIIESRAPENRRISAQRLLAIFRKVDGATVDLSDSYFSLSELQILEPILGFDTLNGGLLIRCKNEKACTASELLLVETIKPTSSDSAVTVINGYSENDLIKRVLHEDQTLSKRVLTTSAQRYWDKYRKTYRPFKKLKIRVRSKLYGPVEKELVLRMMDTPGDLNSIMCTGESEITPKKWFRAENSKLHELSENDTFVANGILPPATYLYQK